MGLLKAGSIAPDFICKNQDGVDVKLKDFSDKPLVMFFFPSNIGMICTRENIEFKENYQKFIDANCHVVGISGDKIKKQKKFHCKNDLPFPLLIDRKRKIEKAFGAHFSRATFVIHNGEIVLSHLTHWFTSKSHIEESLKVVEFLNGNK
ncbi:hypothetical protein DICPUDRAFT_79975 [Dictyostelium purpureum]|uniref:thioredoxin-dependent peroxiredoxin n=1 Tax=Dictyostelium purpureum TaxID=5786 RepID=F0ZP67_DICPU|nr:uncharacterized protein DICPUDRAFT_79975 [Dictyostelium purpureum]EGC34251.1 hypothetical protein DICPUDRAFT_79975 [Dictyostelium purpureum]|eukprot:XP_003289220.1 hypothetical protein DICPUDRAFT_79975 [Dictyostelium purpureum]